MRDETPIETPSHSLRVLQVRFIRVILTVLATWAVSMADRPKDLPTAAASAAAASGAFAPAACGALRGSKGRL